MTIEEENAQLRTHIRQLRQALDEALQRIAILEQQIAERDAGLVERPAAPPPRMPGHRPAGSQPKRRTVADRPRKQRAAQHNRARRREVGEPTTRITHALEQCPTCPYRLRGSSVARRRQVLELPSPPPVQVTEHVVIKRWCPCCARWQTPHLDLGQAVLGQGRLGIGIASLVAWLRTTLRLSTDQVQTYLQTMHQLHISVGEIVALHNQVAEAARPAVQQIQTQIRSSAVVHLDETGWRENGQNGYIWSLSTAQGLRYFEYDPRRAGAVAQRLLGGSFHGHLVSDFYSGYNWYAGAHQRCWSHLLRDLAALAEAWEPDRTVQWWTRHVRNLYYLARRWLRRHDPPDDRQRQQWAQALRTRAQRLGRQYAQPPGHPCGALAKRLLRHADELFEFVRVAGVPPDNNLAERSIRPVVVMRKLSGGSRSAAGSTSRMLLASLFGTWQAQGQPPLDACRTLLSTRPRRSSFPQV